MTAELLAAVEQSALAEALRFWRWTYPLINAGHIIGVALLFGAILPLDLRLLGLWRGVSLASLARVLVPVSGCGLGLALLTGPLLFSVDPFRYAGLPLFWLKLALIGLALVNLILLRRSAAWRSGTVQTAPGRLRLAGLFSALLWLAVILCGRLIAYV